MLFCLRSFFTRNSNDWSHSVLVTVHFPRHHRRLTQTRPSYSHGDRALLDLPRRHHRRHHRRGASQKLHCTAAAGAPAPPRQRRSIEAAHARPRLAAVVSLRGLSEWHTLTLGNRLSPPQLVRPCRCPRWVHTNCGARWQLRCCGKKCVSESLFGASDGVSLVTLCGARRKAPRRPAHPSTPLDLRPPSAARSAGASSALRSSQTGEDPFSLLRSRRPRLTVFSARWRWSSGTGGSGASWRSAEPE